MKKLLVLILLCFAFNNCERDDICSESTPTTPKLIIRFYDISNQSETKRVTNLQIQAVDNEEIYLSATSTDSIAIPLKTIDNDDDPLNGISTQFILHKEYADGGNSGNEDRITFTYNAEEIYVSRACGYKSIFENVEEDLENDGDNWIQLILIEDPLTVENETAAHVQIFH